MPLAAVFTVAPYREPVIQAVIHTVKYASAHDAASAFETLVQRSMIASWIRQCVSDLRAVAVVPVPLHWKRVLHRGFNQSELLAHAVARQGIGSVVDVLERVRVTVPQVDLPHEERHSNVEQAFAVRQRGALAGRDVLLVDDVVTTGATLFACARACREAGARHVYGFALARG